MDQGLSLQDHGFAIGVTNSNYGIVSLILSGNIVFRNNIAKGEKRNRSRFLLGSL